MNTSIDTKTNTPQEKGEALNRQIHEFAGQQIQVALTTNDLSLWLRASSYLQQNASAYTWIFQLERFQNYSFTDFLEGDFNGAENIKHFEKTAEKIHEIYAGLKDLEFQKDIALGLRRVRGDDRSWNYVTLVKFAAPLRDAGFWIYQPNGVPCAEHHCDVLYKATKEQRHQFHLAYKGWEQLHAEANLQADTFATVEFTDVSAEIGELAAAEREITRALCNYYSNLRKIKVPENLLVSL